MLPWTRAVAFVNARVVTADGIASSLRFDRRVLGIDDPPAPRDVVVDAEGAFVLPGLINAHDHLELNHYGRLKRRDRYENATEWIDDLRPVIRDDPAIRTGAAHPLGARLFIGGLKNLLAGVTTVAHHNPRYPGIDRHVPVRVVKRYGWAHSFSMADQPVGANGEPGGDVLDRWTATPPDTPFIVHAGEGVNDRARQELDRLLFLGCLRPNTVIVHGVAMDSDIWGAVVGSGASLVWCPASNMFLFGRTAPVATLSTIAPGARAHICLGTDSRLTGARDLLEELRAAKRTQPLDEETLLGMVTTSAAHVLRLPEAGRIAVGVPADLVVVAAALGTSGGEAPGAALLSASRASLGLVTIAGRPLTGAVSMQRVFTARRTITMRATVDGVDRLIDRALGRRLAASPIAEPGVQVSSV